MELRRLLTELLLLAACVPGVSAADIDSAIVNHLSVIPEITPLLWHNPALEPQKYTTSLSNLEGVWRRDGVERFGRFLAGTYLRTRSLTITADASYDNGVERNRRIAENADVDKVYPYLTFDSIGGDMKLERYTFGGSVAVTLGDRWTIGAGGRYVAGLYYRDVDPRPKDITGTLNLRAGTSFRFSKCYNLAANIGYEKYKQSCDIKFVSELGETTIYHLTGLGHHYDRFAGLGKSSYYNGHTLTAQLSLLPAMDGGFLTVAVGLEKITKILNDLNRLPLNRLDNRTICGEAGWKWRNTAVVGFVERTVRHGYENIFGDAVTGQYPQIGSLGMSLLNYTSGGARFAMERTVGKTVLSLRADASVSRFEESYRGDGRVTYTNYGGGISVGAVTCALSEFVVAVRCAYRPTRYCHSYSGEAEVYRNIASGRYAIGLSGCYARTLSGTRQTEIAIKIKF